MTQVSAGVLAFRWRGDRPQFLLAHPGGPYWARKDEAAWSIHKGLVQVDEASWTAARREFEEEIGQPIDGPGTPIPPHRSPSGKIIHCWLVEADLDLSDVRSNLFEMEWPPKSGLMRSFPEVDRAEYFDQDTARLKIHKGQRALLESAVEKLSADGLPRPD